MDLSSKHNRYLRALAHHLTPAVQVGKNGMTPAIIKEVDRNLGDHELIKVRLSGEDRDDIELSAANVAEETGAALVKLIGHTAIYYRPAEEPKINLPRK